MIIAVDNKNIRKPLGHTNDIKYLKEYYESKGRFPLFSQVLIETRTDCNNRCPFCPHSFNKKELKIMEWEVFCRIIDNLALYKLQWKDCINGFQRTIIRKTIDKDD